MQERAYRDTPDPKMDANAAPAAEKPTPAEYAAAMLREQARAAAELRRDEACRAEAAPRFGQPLAHRVAVIEAQLRALNAADERAARDKESPAEAEAAETESLAHQIQSLRTQINQVDARRADLANRVRKIADKVKGIGFAAGG